jgi:hypothetical protein
MGWRGAGGLGPQGAPPQLKTWLAMAAACDHVGTLKTE